MGSTIYTLEFLEQLPNLQPQGFVTVSGTGALATTIPWGAHVNVVEDGIADSGIFGCQLSGTQSAPFVHATSVTAGP